MTARFLVRLVAAFAACTPMFAQSFSILTSPEEIEMSGDTALFSVQGVPVDGFTASIFLSAASIEEPGARISITPSILNSPYTTLSSMTFVKTGGLVSDSCRIVVTGRNSGVSVHDTVLIRRPPQPAPPTYPGWRVFDTTNSPLPSNTVWAIAMDRQGRQWCATETASHASMA